MSGYTVSSRVGLFNGEVSTLFLPRKTDPARCAVIYAHGANGTGTEPVNFAAHSTGLVLQFARIAQAGYVVLSSDWGGAQTYGNDVELAAMEAGWGWLKASGLCRTDKVILTGGSMGSLSCHRFALDHEAEVAGMNLWIPALDVEQARTNDPIGLRDLINTAWGLPAGSHQGLDGTTVPVRGNPLARAAEANAIPTHLWYSTADTVTPPDAVTRYAAARTGVTTHITSTTAPHGNDAIAGADITTILAFLASIA